MYILRQTFSKTFTNNFVIIDLIIHDAVLQKSTDPRVLRSTIGTDSVTLILIPITRHTLGIQLIVP